MKRNAAIAPVKKTDRCTKQKSYEKGGCNVYPKRHHPKPEPPITKGAADRIPQTRKSVGALAQKLTLLAAGAITRATILCGS